MKGQKGLKITLTVLAIILISLISFGGIFVKNTKFVDNVIPEYQLGMDLKGARTVVMEVDGSTKTVYYDKDGNVVTAETADAQKKEEPVNPKELLTKENYEKSKQIIESRLNQMQVQDYIIRQDENTGKIFVQLPENNNTNLAVQYMVIKGNFTITNDAGEVLMTNQDVASTQVGYGTTQEGTKVLFTINFNKEGTEKFKDITNTYIKTTDEEGKDITKNITLKMDDSTLLTTYFSEEVANGKLQISLGQTTTDAASLQSYLQEASNLSVLFNNGNMPLTYQLASNGNKYIESDLTLESFKVQAIILLSILVIAFICLIVLYGKKGIIAVICYIGYVASVLLVIRFANVVITLQGIAGILASLLINYALTVFILQSTKKMQEVTPHQYQNAMVKAFFILIPEALISIVLCFTNWLPIISFGMTLFWGLMVCVIYNFVFTRTLLVNTVKKEG